MTSSNVVMDILKNCDECDKEFSIKYKDYSLCKKCSYDKRKAEKKEQKRKEKEKLAKAPRCSDCRIIVKDTEYSWSIYGKVYKCEKCKLPNCSDCLNKTTEEFEQCEECRAPPINCTVCNNLFKKKSKNSKEFASSFNYNFRILYNFEKCSNCQGLVKNICNICDSEYIGRDRRICNSCCDIKSYIDWENSIDKSLINEDYIVEARYNISQDSHDGYCSDPGEMKTEYRKEIIGRFRPKMIKDEDIDEHGNIKTDSKVIRLFYRDDDGCKNGSEYCGGVTYYELEEAKVIKK